MARLVALVIPLLCRVAAGAPGDIGVAAPIAGIMAPDDGRWFVLCQARDDTDHDGKLEIRFDIHHNHGDLAKPYLVLGTGAGELIDYPAAESTHGEWFAIVRGHKLELIDPAFHRVVLPADLTNDLEWNDTKNSRFISIAGNATRLAYIRTDNAIVIRELPSGAERVVPMTEKVWRATVDPTGTWAEVKVIRADTDHDGHIEWPGGPQTSSLAGCNVDILHQRQPHANDAVTTRWLELATGKLVDDPTVIGTVGGELLHRMKDDSLVLGAQRIADGACHAQVAGVLEAPARVLVTCGSTITPSPDAPEAAIVVAGAGLSKATRVKEYRYGRDTLSRHERFEYIDDRTFVDFADGSEIALPGKHVAGWRERFVLVDTPSGLATFDLERRLATQLGVHGTVSSDSFGDQVEIDGATYDLRFAKKLAAPDTIAFVDAIGRVLRFSAPAKSGYAPSGPLRWDPP